MALIVSSIDLAVDHADGAVLSAAVDRLRIGRDAVKSWRVERRSIDARKKGEPRLIYSVRLRLDKYDREKRLAKRCAADGVAIDKPQERWRPDRKSVV